MKMAKTFKGLQEMINELDRTLYGYPTFCHDENGNLFFVHRAEEGVAEEIVNRHFMETYGFKPEIKVVEEEYEKDYGEDEYGMPMIAIRVYRHTTVILPSREECVALFKAGNGFDKAKQTLEEGPDMFYYCEVKGLLLAA